jgi:hypothetical protein
MTYDEMRIDAANVFVRMHPDYPAESQEVFDAMNAVIGQNKLDPSKVSHLIRAWALVKAQAPPATASPADDSEQALTEAANGWILAQGGAVAARAKIATMSSEVFSQACLSAVFIRSDEILSGVPAEKWTPAPTPGLGRGDSVREQGLREKQHATEITREAVKGMERSRREYNTSIYTQPEESAQPVVNPIFFNPMGRKPDVAVRKHYTKSELERNERANAARSGVPEKSRADFVRENQEREAKHRAERWKK